jgi:hypothetical protein
MKVSLISVLASRSGRRRRRDEETKRKDIKHGSKGIWPLQEGSYIMGEQQSTEVQ